jgi:hypothetical protein
MKTKCKRFSLFIIGCVLLSSVIYGGQLIFSDNIAQNKSIEYPTKVPENEPKPSPYVQTWNRTWGGNGTWNDRAYDMWSDNAGNIYTTGLANNDGLEQGLILKYDTAGNYCWNISYISPVALTPVTSGTYTKCIWGETSGDYIYIAGYGWNNTGVSRNTWIVLKYNVAGTTPLKVWEKIWYSDANQNAKDIWGDNSGNLYVVGTTSKGFNGSYDGQIAKYSSSTGAKLWNLTWGEYYSDSCNEIELDSDGNIYISATANNFPQSLQSVYLLKYSSAGTQVWNRTWGSSKVDESIGLWIEPTTKNVYQLMNLDWWDVGTTTLVKYNPSGNLLLNKTIYDNFVGSEICGSNDGRLLIVGTSTGDIRIVTTDLNANLIWSYTWGEYGKSDEASNIWIDANGVVYISGSTQKNSPNFIESLLIRFDKSYVPNAPVLISATPNPSSIQYITFQWSSVSDADNYNIYKSTKSITIINGTQSSIDTVTPPTVTVIHMLSSYGIYYFAVVAANETGYSPVSNCLRVEYSATNTTTSTTSTTSTNSTSSGTNSTSTSASNESSTGSIDGIPDLYMVGICILSIVVIVFSSNKHKTIKTR